MDTTADPADIDATDAPATDTPPLSLPSAAPGSRPRQLKPPRPRPAPEPQLVDRIFDYLLAEPELVAALDGIAQRSGKTLQDIKLGVFKEFDGEPGVSYRKALMSDPTRGVLALFNGRNATEVARRLEVSRATVYRHIKQPGGQR